MGDYKKQHTVTEAYLRRFCLSNTPNSLWRYDKQTGECERCNVDRATVRHYLYSIKLEDGSLDHTVEKALGEIEREAIPLLDILQSRSFLSRLQRNSIATFIATMIRRTPGVIDHFQQAGSAFSEDPRNDESILQATIEHFKDQYSEEEIRRIVAPHMAAGGHKSSAEELKAKQYDAWGRNVGRAAGTIEPLEWQVLDAGRESFFTSDAPAFVRPLGDPDVRRNEYLPPASHEAELIFPLSARYLLRGIHSPCPRSQRATKTRVYELNARIVRMAERYIFVGQPSDAIASLFEANRYDQRPLPPAVTYDRMQRR
jgi:hypothetical protein